MDIVMNVIRTLGFALDNVIYSLIPIVYKLFIYLSEIDLFSMTEDSALSHLVQRVYVLLGIFMLFKVAFSLLQYLIDPNSFSDKSKGFGKLVTNAIVTIVLLVSVPFIFQTAMKLQTEIVTSNAIGTLILGETAGQIVIPNSGENEKKLDTSTVDEMAADVQFLMYGAFFSVNPKAIPECKNSPVFGTVSMALNYNEGDGQGNGKGCLQVLKEQFESPDNDMYAAGVGLNDFFKTNDGERNFGSFDKLLWWSIDGEYAINYLPFVSAIAGLYVVFLLVSFSIDIAVRAIKLCFLEMVAPIAIVSYIDPKETISNSKLRNWIKECATTYFSLFLRLATIFLVMVLISAIASGVLADDGPISKQVNDNEYNIWIYLFLIIGAFMFAKKVPQMIESIFGIKMSGDLSLNPFKSIRENAIANPLVSGAIGGVVGAGATALGAFSTARSMDRGIGRSLLSAAGGLGSGFTRGGVAGMGSGGKNIMANASRVTGQTTRAMELRDTTKFKDRMEARFRNAVGAQSKYETLENRAKVFDSVSQYASAMEDRAKDQLMKKDAKWQQIQTERLVAEQDLKNGVITQQAYNEAMGQFHNREDELVETFINNGGLTDYTTGQIKKDAELGHTREALNRVVRENKLDYKTDSWKDIDGSGKDAKAQAQNVRYSDEYENAKAVHEMQKSGMMQSHMKK
ncbi:MAG: hypothetical protein HFH47_01550 [Bacilli bacterium]|nr:hypothetical protein [Bacilli bacterium]